jgi:hypothetical protein
MKGPPKTIRCTLLLDRAALADAVALKQPARGPEIPDFESQLRFSLDDSARILGLTRSQLDVRLQSGTLKAQKDGPLVFIAAAELKRYVEGCGVAGGP